MSELPVCKLCDNYPVNYHTGAFGVKHHCDNKHCTLNNVLFTSEQWRTLMGEPEGFVLVPAELTAENGAKAALMGEFREVVIMACNHCDNGNIDDEFSDECDGSGEYELHVHVQWRTIKEIWKKAVEVVKQ